MKVLLLVAAVVTVLFGLTKLRSQRRGEDVWHEVTSR
ncbi:DLW-39 family protein [Rhodococcus kronopolitis]|uniref:DLW-39 family protein n=1 Tax=Rhodococcus kronopolitis TaxID=1460226 RepID=A0ABV9G021_9NOCA